MDSTSSDQHHLILIVVECGHEGSAIFRENKLLNAEPVDDVVTNEVGYSSSIGSSQSYFLQGKFSIDLLDDKLGVFLHLKSTNSHL